MTNIKSCLLCENCNTHPCKCEHCEDWDNFRISEDGKALREKIYGDGYQDGHRDGYDKGYDDGEDDAVNGSGYEYQFDDETKYKGQKKKDFQIGYAEGYEAGYDDNMSEYHD